MANGLLTHYAELGMSVWHLKLIAFRTVSKCISVLGGLFGVGGEVRMWAAEGGPFEELDSTALERAGHGVAQWELEELESLKRVGGEGAAEEAEEPLPEELEPD